LRDQCISFLDATLTITKLSKINRRREAASPEGVTNFTAPNRRSAVWANRSGCSRLYSFYVSIRPVNPKPTAFRVGFSCGDDGDRTRDLVVANHALSQLSYIPARP